MTTGFPSHNPYNRAPFPDGVKHILHSRIAWLRSRKYPILHTNTDILTVEQIWNHKVLDIFLKIEALGYYVSCEWYHKLAVNDHIQFYRNLFRLWDWKLGISRANKEALIPGYQSGAHPIFRFHPDDTPYKSSHWWEKNNLALIEAFIGRSPDKEQQKLGAMYVLMALTSVSHAAAEALPWLVQ